MSSEIRELTKGEKKAIRALVLNHCANHDPKLGCIVIDGKCYMLQKEYCSHSLCKYFRNVVLPNDPILEAVGSPTASISELLVLGEKVF